MPFKSQKQMRAAFGGYLGPEMKKKAPEWAKETPNMSKLPKKVKKENEDGSVGQLFLVTKTQPGCAQDNMVRPIDPLVGLSGSEIVPDQVHGVYHDEEMAHSIAETLCKQCMEAESMLEEKKGTVAEKLKKAISKLQAQHKDHVKMATEDPKNASSHRQHIAKIAHQIDDMMSKLEKIEKSKKPVDKKEDKEDSKEKLKEAKDILKQSKLSSKEYQSAKKMKDFKSSDWTWNKEEELYIKKKK